MKRENRLPFVVCAGFGALLLVWAIMSRGNMIDFKVYYYAGLALLKGRTDLYAPDFTFHPLLGYRYLPFFLLLFLPLSLLPYQLSSILWQLILAASFGAMLWSVSKLDKEMRPWRWNWWLAVLSVLPYYGLCVNFANAHLIMAALTFGALALFLRRHLLWSSLLLSLGVTIKITPGIFLIWFVIRREWRALTLTSLFLLLLNAAPALYFGWARNQRLVGEWVSHVVMNQEYHDLNSGINQSLKGQLQRYLSRVDYERRETGDTDYPQVYVVNLTSEAIDLIYWLLVLMTSSGVLAILIMSARREGDPLLESALAMCLMLFIGPYAHKLYFVMLLWPLSVLAIRSRVDGADGLAARWALCLVGGINILFPLLPGHALQRRLLVVGVDFFVNLVLLVTLAGLAYRASAAKQGKLAQTLGGDFVATCKSYE